MNFVLLSEKKKGIIALILLALIFGMIPVMLRYIGTVFDIFQQLYLRMFFGVIFTVILFRKQIRFKKLFHLSLRAYSWIFLRSAMYFLIGVGLYNSAVLITKISNVVLIETIPMSAILGFVLLHEKVTKGKIISILLTCLGVFIISFKGMSGGFHFGLGEIFTLASALFTSLGLISRRMTKSVLNDYEIGLLMLFFAGIQFFVTSLFVGSSLPIHGWNLAILFLLILGGFFNVGITVLMNYGFARIEAVLGGNILTLQILFASILAFIFFQEIPNAREVIGGIFVLTGVIILQRIESKKEKNS